MLAAFSTVAIFFLLQGGTAYFELHDVIGKYDHIARVNFGNTVSLAVMRGLTKDIRGLMYRLGIPTNSSDDIINIRKLEKDTFKKYEELTKKYSNHDFSEGERKLYVAQAEKWQVFAENVSKLVELSQFRTPSERDQFYRVLSTSFKASVEDYFHELQALIDFQDVEVNSWTKQAEDTASKSNLVSMVIISVGFGLALLIGFIFSGVLARQLSELAAHLLENANSVALASKQVSGAGSELSASTTEQAAALQETVASIDEVSAMVHKNADNAKRSQEVSLISNDTALKGKQVVESMIQSIDDINRSNNDIMQQIESSNHQISEIVKVISEIGSKTKVINDIVFQTKLLSFNASVEAARAGEHGKGFAVVAEEVGNLAQMSGNAAKEISQMLEGSIKKVEGIVGDTKSKVEKLVILGKEKVQTGTTTARRCGEVLDEIVKNVNEVNSMISEISTASSEQAQGVQEINKAMGQMDQVTQQNATASQGVAGAAEQLTTQADSLRNLVQGLLHTVQGAKADSMAVEKFSSMNHLKSKNVVQFKKKVTVATSTRSFASDRSVPEQELKKAVGSNGIPAQDDPRFEDI